LFEEITTVVKVYRFEFWLIFRYNSLPTKFPVEPYIQIEKAKKDYHEIGNYPYEEYLKRIINIMDSPDSV
jgi:hypothetical protein